MCNRLCHFVVWSDAAGLINGRARTRNFEGCKVQACGSTVGHLRL